MAQKLPSLPALLVTLFVLMGAGIAISKMIFPSDPQSQQVAVRMPKLSPEAVRGQKAFLETCAQCHGERADGTDQGPPLVHDLYNPGHHADESFRRAVALGVRRHHWPFGDMAKQAHVKPREVESIIRFVRELQAANGIKAKAHRM